MISKKMTVKKNGQKISQKNGQKYLKKNGQKYLKKNPYI